MFFLLSIYSSATLHISSVEIQRASWNLEKTICVVYNIYNIDSWGNFFANKNKCGRQYVASIKKLELGTFHLSELKVGMM